MNMALSSFHDFVEEGLRIVKAAEKEAITLRLMGALAVFVHCPRHASFYEKMDRAPTDIDVVSNSKFRKRLTSFLQTLGYTTDIRLMSYPTYSDAKRYVYHGKTRLDVFFDELRMCHTINWEDRLEIDNPTIPVADIVLEKLQIVEINPKDIKDLVILLLEHGVGHTDQDMVNGNYMSELLSKDWGFHYTATTNLKKILDLMGNYVSLSNDERDTVTERVNTLLDIIEKKQKSLAWRMRAQIGAKRKWYTDVAEDQTPTRVE